jgi:hypothetical protein
MAITFENVHEGASGSWTLQSGKSYTVDVRAESDTPVGPETVISAAGFSVGDTYRWPLVGAPLETHDRLYIQSIDVQPDGEDSRRWKLSVQYGVTDPGQQGHDPDEGYDPFAVPPTFRAYSEDEDFFPLTDINAQPLVNSAGDFMSDISVKIPVLTFEIGVVVPAFDWAAIKACKNHINVAPWEGFDAGVVYLADVNPSRVWDERAGFFVWQVVYVFQVKDPIVVEYSAQDVQVIPGWSLCVLDAGLRQKVGGKKVPILSEGVPTSEPLPLKADGTAVGPTDDLHFLYFDVIPRADFSILPIPAGIFA